MKNLEAGKLLDKLIAEKIFGCSPQRNITANGFECGCLPMNPEHERMKSGWSSIPFYSTDIAEAWKVVEKIANWKFTLTWKYEYEPDKEGKEQRFYATAIFDPILIDRREYLFAQGDTAPEAICLAALKALGMKE